MSDLYKAVVGPLLIGVSLLTTDQHFSLVVQGIGINWTGEGLASLGKYVEDKALRSSDVKEVYRRAFEKAARKLQKEYEQKYGLAESSAFELLKQSYNFIQFVELPSSSVSIDLIDKELGQGVDSLLYGHNTRVLEFIKHNLLDKSVQEFRIALAQNEIPWRLYHGWILEKVSQSTSQLDKDVRALHSKLDELQVSITGLNNHLLSFDDLIASKTDGFVGRDFVFEQFEEYLRTEKSGYFVICGQPGIGKSSLLAELIRREGYLHHFNIATQNIKSPKLFLANICSQIIIRYNLKYRALPESASENSNFLMQCLSQASQQHAQPLVIVVDAVDESDYLNLAPQVNALYLPDQLPKNVFILLSTRNKSDIPLPAEGIRELYLDSQSAANQNDIKTHIRNFITSNNLLEFVRLYYQTIDAFVDTLYTKSEGNFMYLHYVLPAIRGGRLTDVMDKLPEGLNGYYSRHWRQMRDGLGHRFFEVFEPIVAVLAVAAEPVSISQVSNWTKLPLSTVTEAIQLWFEFLRPSNSATESRYSIYHASFQDFLKTRVDLNNYRGLIADYYLNKWGI